MILLHCSPTDAFSLFGNMVLKYETLFNFYTMKMDFINSYYKVFWRLLKENANDLFLELTAPDEIVSGSVFLFGWVMSLFTQALPLSLTGFLWDQISLHGQWEIMRAALAICLAVKAKVGKAADWQRVLRDCGVYLVTPEEIQPFVRRVQKNVDLHRVAMLLQEAAGLSGAVEWEWK